MTNRLHRQGSPESLKSDYVIFVHAAGRINREGSAPKIREFLQICLKHRPANIGFGRQGNTFQDDVTIEKLLANLGDGSGVSAVFADIVSLQRVLEDLIRADLGISINISGLMDEVQACCRRAGFERHSTEHSLGFWGAKDRLPEREILEFNTMCGHGMVSFNFIRKMIDSVKLRRLTPKEAAGMLAKFCECGAFNPVRAEILLKRISKGER